MFSTSTVRHMRQFISLTLSATFGCVLLSSAELSSIANADSVAQNGNQSSKKIDVVTFTGKGAPVCKALATEMKRMITAGVVDGCLIGTNDADNTAHEIAWPVGDYSQHIDEIKRAYITVEANDRSYAQLTIGPKHPELAGRTDQPESRLVAELFWSQYGPLILDAFKRQEIVLHVADVDLFGDGTVYHLTRVPIVEPEVGNGQALSKRYCSAAHQVPTEFVVADPNQSEALDRWLLGMSYNSGIMTYHGQSFWVSRDPISIEVDKLKKRIPPSQDVFAETICNIRFDQKK